MTIKTVRNTPDQIATKILLIRNQKVILLPDLAELYEVTPKRLSEQLRRNIDRFPPDFAFQLTKEEKEDAANCGILKNLKFSKTNPYVFTEHGAIMAASILNSPKAIEASVLVIRTFVKLRQLLNTNLKLKNKLFELENRLDMHDDTIKTLINTIHQLMETPESSNKPKIGFESWQPA